MKTAIMQPYIFPYIGYWQLINAVDTFVILDDVNFIMRGYINRNNILFNGTAKMFSISLSGASQNKLICDTKLSFKNKERESFLKTLHLSYKKAPFFNDFYPILEKIILNSTDDLTDFLENSLIKTLDYLGIKKKILRSSQIKKDNNLKAEARIIAVCKELDTNIYVNPIGGQALYSQDSFTKENMELRFIKTIFEDINYKQFKNDFVPNLSFLDVLMFNSKEEIKNMLNKYMLIEGENNV